MKVLEWPPQSSDFNILENLWRDLKHAIHARSPNNISGLEALCQGEKIQKRELLAPGSV